jgi:cellulose synthase/poly-beta-1,6-N-acetylglucosamine synthase-like glycosyltransferase
MGIPFTVEQFYGVFRSYNTAVWPAQWLFVMLALAAVGAVLRPRPWSGAVVSAILGLLWAWMAVAYHLAFFVRISPAAYGFAALSAAGAMVFVWQGVVLRRLSFRWQSGLRALAGVSLTAFALVVYPVWSAYAGHPYPETPTFGLPCPTTIFAIGLLCFATPPTPSSPLIAPVLWCLVGAQAALFLGVQPDLGLIAAGVVGAALIATARQPPRASNP